MSSNFSNIFRHIIIMFAFLYNVLLFSRFKIAFIVKSVISFTSKIKVLKYRGSILSSKLISNRYEIKEKILFVFLPIILKLILFFKIIEIFSRTSNMILHWSFSSFNSMKKSLLICELYLHLLLMKFSINENKIFCLFKTEIPVKQLDK